MDIGNCKSDFGKAKGFSNAEHFFMKIVLILKFPISNLTFQIAPSLYILAFVHHLKIILILKTKPNNNNSNKIDYLLYLSSVTPRWP